MARRVGVLGAEGGAKRVDVAEGHGEVLGVELAGDRKARMLAEEVLAPVHVAGSEGATALLGGLGAHERRVLGVERGDAEHLAGALAVARGDEWRVDVDEVALLEEAVDGGGGHGADAEHGAEQVRARAQVLLRAQELDRGTLLLQRVVGSAGALDRDGLGRELEGLLGVGRELERAGAHERVIAREVRDLVIVGERLAVHDDLKVLEAAAVVERDEAKVLHVADGLGPAGDGDGLSAELLRAAVQLDDLGAIHVFFSLLRAADAGGPRPWSGRMKSERR